MLMMIVRARVSEGDVVVLFLGGQFCFCRLRADTRY